METTVGLFTRDSAFTDTRLLYNIAPSTRTSKTRAFALSFGKLLIIGVFPKAIFQRLPTALPFQNIPPGTCGPTTISSLLEKGKLRRKAWKDRLYQLLVHKFLCPTAYKFTRLAP